MPCGWEDSRRSGVVLLNYLPFVTVSIFDTYMYEIFCRLFSYLTAISRFLLVHCCTCVWYVRAIRQLSVALACLRIIKNDNEVWTTAGHFLTIRYDTTRDAIFTRARRPTWVSLIYRTEPNCKTEKLKSMFVFLSFSCFYLSLAITF